MLDVVNKIYSEIAILTHLRGHVRRRFAAALIPRLVWNNIPGHTTRAPPMQTQPAVRVGFEVQLRTGNRRRPTASISMSLPARTRHPCTRSWPRIKAQPTGRKLRVKPKLYIPQTPKTESPKTESPKTESPKTESTHGESEDGEYNKNYVDKLIFPAMEMETALSGRGWNTSWPWGRVGSAQISSP